jgi:hypothetical protein
MKKVLLYVTLLVVLSSFVLNTNQGIKTLVQANLNDYSNKDWPEKIYVHTDKPLYTHDDNLWFTVYLVNGITHKNSTKSQVVYVELFNAKDEIVASKRLFVEEVSTAGHFKIKSDWLPGEYLIRAYTNYMRNEEPHTFFQKNIRVVGMKDKEPPSSSQKAENLKSKSLHLSKPELHFYPEGGHLVTNLNTKVALKIKDPIYQDYKLPVEIVDSNGELITSFTTAEFGLGFFYLRPKANKQYFANINLKGTVYQYPLPKALVEGYSVAANQKNEELIIEWSTNTSTGLKNAYLLIHQRGKILFDKIGNTNDTRERLSVYTGNLSDGVTHITVFNSKGQPVCERLVFINNPNNTITANISKNKSVYQTRDQVALQLELQDVDNLNYSGHISLSVTDADALPISSHSSSIKTWLLLNSDLRGTIENPGYFFSEGDSIKKAYLLDLVMLTNGWRRFTWQNLLESPVKDLDFSIEKGLFITGTTSLLESPEDRVSSINSISFLGRDEISIESVNSDKNGHFEFGPYVFFDSIPTIIESKIADPNIKTQDNYKDVLINIESHIHQPPKLYRNPLDSQYQFSENLNEDFITTAQYKRILNLEYEESRQRLDEILLTATIQTDTEKRALAMEERSLFGAPTRRVDVSSDRYLKKTNLQYILQQFPGIRITGLGPNYRGEPTQIFYNNAIVDFQFISNLNPESISFIDFYGPEQSFYARTPGGAFVIYGKLGIETKIQPSSKPGIVNFISRGFDSPKEFFAPDYSKDLDQVRVTDIRTTLHWAPKIRFTEDQPTQTLNFFTCDMKGRYVITIEGITDSGIPIYQNSYFVVE